MKRFSSSKETLLGPANAVTNYVDHVLGVPLFQMGYWGGGAPRSRSTCQKPHAEANTLGDRLAGPFDGDGGWVVGHTHRPPRARRGRFAPYPRHVPVLQSGFEAAALALLPHLSEHELGWCCLVAYWRRIDDTVVARCISAVIFTPAGMWFVGDRS
jgi:hypothetical protein